MAKVTGRTEQNLFARVIGPILRYLRETRAELRKVTWPTREEALHLTLIVLGTTIVMSILLGIADFIFGRIMAGVIIGDLLLIIVGILTVIGGVVALYFFGRE